MEVKKINNFTAELNIIHIPELEYERLGMVTERNNEYTFFSAIFDEGIIVYLYHNKEQTFTDKTKEDFPYFSGLIKDFVGDNVKIVIIHNMAYPNVELPNFRSLQDI